MTDASEAITRNNSMRLGTKIRRVVTLSTEARRVRHQEIEALERHFRGVLVKMKSIVTLVDKVESASLKHTKSYQEVSSLP